MNRIPFRWVLLFAGLLTLPVYGAGQTRTPAFRLKDSEGKERALTSFYGRPLALFFFCPCAECHRIAELWGKTQRSGALTLKPAAKKGRPALNPKHPASNAGATGGAGGTSLLTLVIFAGEAEEVKRFAAETDLDLAQTALLCDPDSATAQAYDAIPCPRVFALGSDGKLHYTNRLPGAKTSVIEPVTVVTRVALALAPVSPVNAKGRTDVKKRAAPRKAGEEK